MAKHYRLRSMPYAQANVGIEGVNGELIAVYLYSYNTLAATINLVTRTPTLYCKGIYSSIMGRHISCFTREFCGRSLYYECKEAVQSGVGYTDGRVDAQIDIRDVLSAVDWYKEHGKRYHGKY